MRTTKVLLPLSLVGVLLAAACSSDHGDDHAGHGENSPVAEDAREIAVTAEELRFDPDEITVESGEDIAIALHSVDILHDFVIDEFDAHVAADAGETATGGFTAGEPGRYTYYCDVEGHREAGMEGSLIVEGDQRSIDGRPVR